MIRRAHNTYRYFVVTFYALLLIPSGVIAQDDVVPIYAIQSARAASPLDGQRVDTYGVVTAVTANGFYLQDPLGDGDPQTSDALYVYTQRRPKVTAGECVHVDYGLVDEFYDKTELTAVWLRNITPSDLCATIALEPIAIPLARLGIDPVERFEQYEGMLVEVTALGGIVQGPTKRFRSGEAEITFVAEPHLDYVEGGRIFQWQAENTPALMYLSNAFGIDLPDLGFGDRLDTAVGLGDDGAVLAVLDYNFGKYQIIALPGQAFTGEDRPFVPNVGFAATDDAFTICTLNALSLGRGTAQYRRKAEYAGQLRKRAHAIAESLQGCTIIGVQETGTPEDAENLAALLTDKFALPYTAIAIQGPGTLSAEFPLTNSVLVRSDRVEILDVALRQGCSALNYDVAPLPGACARGTFDLFNRPPLVVDVRVTGDWDEAYQLTIITNHWKSKGGDESINVVRRTAQAAHVAALVQEKLDADPDAHIVVVGDLNDYYASGPVETLETAVDPDMVHVYDYLPAMSRYTYIFNGASQVLDHILVTPNMIPTLAGVTPVHINADYAYPDELDPESIHHSSDHDPVVMRIRPAGASWLMGNVTFADINVQVHTRGGTLLAAATSDAQGEVRLWNLTSGAYMVSWQVPDFIELAKREAIVLLVPGQNELPTNDAQHRAARLGAALMVLSAPLGNLVAPPPE